MENRIKVWLNVQAEGTAKLKKLEEQVQQHETRTSEAIRRNVEHGGAMNAKVVESLSAMDAKIEEYEALNLERFETLRDFRTTLAN